MSVPAVSGDVVIRQRLKHREDSKDSAFDGSIVSVGTNAEDDVTIPSRAVALSNVTQSKPISLPKIESSPGAVPKTLPILEKYSVAKYLRNDLSFFFFSRYPGQRLWLRVKIWKTLERAPYYPPN